MEFLFGFHASETRRKKRKKPNRIQKFSAFFLWISSDFGSIRCVLDGTQIVSCRQWRALRVYKMKSPNDNRSRWHGYCLRNKSVCFALNIMLITHVASRYGFRLLAVGWPVAMSVSTLDQYSIISNLILYLSFVIVDSTHDLHTFAFNRIQNLSH